MQSQTEHPRRYEMHPTAAAVDLEALGDSLRRHVRGEVRLDAGARAAWSTDASNFRQIPLAVVLPVDAEDLEATLAACREVGAPVTHRGGATSLAGQTTNAAVIVDCSKHLRGILQLDPDRRIARVQPGVVLDDLRRAAEEHGLTFGPDPATHDRCTLGGMIGNNSCGTHSIMAGRTVDNVESLEVACYDGTRLHLGPLDEDARQRAVSGGGRWGEIVAGLGDLARLHEGEIRARFPDIPRRVSGYNLDELLAERGFHLARAVVGTEGTCVSVLEATLRLIPSPPVRLLVVLGYPDAFVAADTVPDLLAAGPLAIEGIDARLLENMASKGLRSRERSMLPEGQAFLFVEVG
ncbi:MAG: FAD-binding oxidoreductase, partial [Acidimicrobiales bacterium]